MNDRYSNPTASHAIASIQGRPEGTAMDASVKAWTASPPLPYRNDQRVHPWDHFWGYYYRWKRRPRCGEIGGADGR